MNVIPQMKATQKRIPVARYRALIDHATWEHLIYRAGHNSRDAQEQYPLPKSMVNVADPLMGGAYDTLVSAFGTDVAWVLGHLAILAVITALISVMRNWSRISEGAQLTRGHALDAVAIVLFTAIQTQYFSSPLAWPLSQAVLIAVSSTLSLRWCINVLN